MHTLVFRSVLVTRAVQWFLKNSFTRALLATSRKCPMHIDICAHANHEQQVVYYTPYHVEGQVSIIRNGVYRGWIDCGQMTDITSFTRTPPLLNASNVRVYDSLVNFVADGGWSFQHFIDNVMPKIAHAWELLQGNPNTKMLIDMSDKRHAKQVLALLEHIGYGSDRVVEHSLSHTTVGREFIVACHAPPIHPYLWSKMQTLLRIPYVPLAQRTVITYLSRNNKKEHSNAGRTVINEQQVLQALRLYAQRQSPPLDVQVFSSSAVNTPTKVIEYFQHVKFMIGPHGGAFYNQVFAANETILIEFMPVLRAEYRSTMRHPAKMVWTMASLLNQTYYQMPCEASKPDDTADMTVDIDVLLSILDTQLTTP
jgi:hypothetical protein